mmetsp:Transcript_22222/g.57068  ORF Transcript_22222/g.57068 Transcript_22222/m.57068 type:complete len:132 (-) Transcript_22222:2342-2737(-)
MSMFQKLPDIDHVLEVEGNVELKLHRVNFGSSMAGSPDGLQKDGTTRPSSGADRFSRGDGGGLPRLLPRVLVFATMRTLRAGDVDEATVSLSSVSYCRPCQADVLMIRLTSLGSLCSMVSSNCTASARRGT